MRRAGTFDEGKARFYVASVALALQHLHSLRLVHRDVKPENVVLDAGGHAQRADLGFCLRITDRTLHSNPHYK